MSSSNTTRPRKQKAVAATTAVVKLSDHGSDASPAASKDVENDTKNKHTTPHSTHTQVVCVHSDEYRACCGADFGHKQQQPAGAHVEHLIALRREEVRAKHRQQNLQRDVCHCDITLQTNSCHCDFTDTGSSQVNSSEEAGHNDRQPKHPLVDTMADTLHSVQIVSPELATLIRRVRFSGF